MKITLYSRNSLQNKFFSGVSLKLESMGHEIDLLLPLSGTHKNKSIYYPEKEISDDITNSEIDIEADFNRIVCQYKNINRIIQSERELNYYRLYFGADSVSRKDKLTFLVYAFRWFENYTERTNPSVVVSEMVTGMFDGVFKEVCTYKSIPYIGIRSSKLRPGIVFCEDVFDQPTGLDDEYRKNLTKEIGELISSSRLALTSLKMKNSAPHYMVHTKKKFSLLTTNTFRRLVQLLFTKDNLPRNSIQQFKVLNAFREKFIRWKNLRQIHHNKLEWSSLKNYFVYACHFEPEASVHVRAHLHSDQLGLIKQLSRLLPAETILIVKEHRGNSGFRKPNFYRELSHHYNIVLASPEVNLRDLVKRSKAVITLTGRIGLEALLEGIPVLAFGESFWTKLPGVIKEDSPAKLEKILRELGERQNQHERKVGTKSTLALICAYESLTYKGCFIHGSDEFLTEENYEVVAMSLNRYIVANFRK